MRRKQSQKEFERYIARQAASKLSESWMIEDHEGPDFLVRAGTNCFGLEVTECHAGPKGKRGAVKRQTEAFNYDWLASVRQEFGETCDAPLNVRYYGEASDSARTQLLAALRSARFDERSEFYSLYQSFGTGKVFAFKTPRAVWNVFSDRGAPMERDGRFLQREIDTKAAKLLDYRNACTAVRLLAFTFPLYNSGKFELPEGFEPDLRGFDAVYFFSYPTSVKAFHSHL